jgi:hypothetical protein
MSAKPIIPPILFGSNALNNRAAAGKFNGGTSSILLAQMSGSSHLRNVLQGY